MSKPDRKPERRVRGVSGAALWIFFLLVAPGCSQVAKTELRIFKPSIVRAEVIDENGARIEEFDPSRAEVIHLRVLATGFTPVKAVELRPHHAGPRKIRIPLHQISYKVFDLEISHLLKAHHELHPDEPFEMTVVATDIEDDQTMTDPIVLWSRARTLAVPAH